jgi:hypothetical protein
MTRVYTGDVEVPTANPDIPIRTTAVRGVTRRPGGEVEGLRK